MLDIKNSEKQPLTGAGERWIGQGLFRFSEKQNIYHHAAASRRNRVETLYFFALLQEDRAGVN